MSVNVTGEGPWGPGTGGVFGKSPPLYDRPVRGVGVGVCATALTEHATKMRNRHGRNGSSLRNLRVLCVSAVNLVPRKLTAETQSMRRLRRVRFATDFVCDPALDLFNFLLRFINQLIVPFVRNPGVLPNLRRI